MLRRKGQSSLVFLGDWIFLVIFSIGYLELFKIFSKKQSLDED